jgi:undecaprenyl diphosphate synthase
LELNVIDNLKIPLHIGIILDGNRSWAKRRFLPSKIGHMNGANNLKKIANAASDLGVKYLTVYSFSTENWKRSKEEIDDIFNIFKSKLDDQIKEIILGNTTNNFKINFIGDINRLPNKLQSKIYKLSSLTKNKTGMNLIIAISYGGRNEILRAIKKICNLVIEKKLSIDDVSNISEDMFSNYLDTKDIPDPDLIIRTSGQRRVSNFLLWQMAYTEFYFCDKYWPDFTEHDLTDAIKEFSQRNRKFGNQ